MGYKSALTDYVYDRLRQNIARGAYTGGRLPTEVQLGDDLEVSVTTVRRAEDRLITEGRIEKIQGKGTFIRGRFGPTTAKKTICTVLTSQVGRVRLRAWDDVYEGLVGSIDYSKYDLYPVLPPREPDRREEFLSHALYGRDVDYLVVLGSHRYLDGFLREKRGRVPAVSVTNVQYGHSSAAITPNYVQGLGTALRYLNDLGHTRIAFIHFCRWDRLGNEMKRTMKDFGEGIGVRCPDEYLSYVTMGELDETACRLKEFLSLRPAPTAVICANDQIAEVVCFTCRQLGVAVPGDLSVVGFNALREMQKAETPLTTIDTRSTYLGKRAVELVCTRGHERHFHLIHEMVDVELREGKTCARTRGKR